MGYLIFRAKLPTPYFLGLWLWLLWTHRSKYTYTQIYSWNWNTNHTAVISSCFDLPLFSIENMLHQFCFVRGSDNLRALSLAMWNILWKTKWKFHLLPCVSVECLFQYSISYPRNIYLSSKSWKRRINITCTVPVDFLKWSSFCKPISALKSTRNGQAETFKMCISTGKSCQ